jgi:DNA-binding transcriptional MerR regulator
LYLSIKEASQQLGIAPPSIRFYERKGLLPFLKRDDNGNRIFEPRDLEWLNLLIWFRTTGMTVADLQRFVALAVQGEATIPDRQQLLEKHKLELQRRQAELDKAFEAVNRKLDQFKSYQRDKSLQPTEMPDQHNTMTHPILNSGSMCL